jgi:hypothetical protein
MDAVICQWNLNGPRLLIWRSDDRRAMASGFGLIRQSVSGIRHRTRKPDQFAVYSW